VSRREQILQQAAELFAARGFHGVSMTDLGAAVGISGPALYKHFPSKESMLAEMLVSISEELLETGRARVDAAGTATPDGAWASVAALVDWHVHFALTNRALIVVQDRDWSSLPDDARERVRRLQREYVDLWAAQLRSLRPGLDRDRARAMAHVAFGLINSTPHSGLLPDDAMRDLLRDMALAALAPGPAPQGSPPDPTVPSVPTVPSGAAEPSAGPVSPASSRAAR
jgi:AcrR family transcriptional regulator